ncbi:MAG: hypothetical protein ACRC33_06165 [Gemmataceae bacterium]
MQAELKPSGLRRAAAFVFAAVVFVATWAGGMWLAVELIRRLPPEYRGVHRPLGDMPAEAVLTHAGAVVTFVAAAAAGILACGWVYHGGRKRGDAPSGRR